MKRKANDEVDVPYAKRQVSTVFLKLCQVVIQSFLKHIDTASRN